MKITFVSGVMGNGGAERVVATLASGFAESGIDVDVITIYGKKQDYALSDKVHMYPVCRRSRIKPLRPIVRILAVRKYLRENKTDCIVSFMADVNIHVILARMGLKCPLIVSERNDPVRDPKKKWKRIMRDILYRKADGIVFQTPEAKSYFSAFLPSRIGTKIISNPLMEGLPYYGTGTGNGRLITACRLTGQKNLKLMIDAVDAVLKSGIPCTLDIFGDGVLKEELQRYIEALGLRDVIRLKGFSGNIHEEMLRSEAFIISSDYEGISNSMLEALAVGIPVIATDCPVGGARMFVEPGVNGWLVPVNDLPALTEAISRVLTGKAELVGMEKKRSELRRDLNASAITQAWHSFICETMEK